MHHPERPHVVVVQQKSNAWIVVLAILAFLVIAPVAACAGCIVLGGVASSVGPKE